MYTRAVEAREGARGSVGGDDGSPRLQKTGPGMMRSRWWLNMYELERERVRPRAMSSIGDAGCGLEVERERLFWNQSRALPSTRSVRDMRRPTSCGELERLSSLFMLARRGRTRGEESATGEQGSRREAARDVLSGASLAFLLNA